MIYLLPRLARDEQELKGRQPSMTLSLLSAILHSGNPDGQEQRPYFFHTSAHKG